MKLRDEFDKQQGDKWMKPWSDKVEIEWQATYIRFLEEKIKQCNIASVVGQSEQLKCGGCGYTYDVMQINKDGYIRCVDCAF